MIFKRKEKAKREVEIPTMEEIEAERDRVRYQNRYRSTLRSTTAALIVAAAAGVLLATLWMPVLQIYGESMSPTLEDGQIVIAVKSKSFDNNDLVAFYYGNKLLVKRVIAGPGEWVNIEEDGTVYVNGVKLVEPYVDSLALGECDITFPYQVPDEKWFLMGDNRSVSIDSRSTQVGCASADQIVGRIILRVWPLGDIGLFN